MDKKIFILNLFVILALTISACNLPSETSAENAASTAAAQTVQALLSATPAVVIQSTNTPIPMTATPTNTLAPLNTNTPAATATSNCYLGQFIRDVTIPDGTIMTPGQTFTKTWRLKNIGSCAWNGFSLVFDSGDSMNGPATSAIPAVGVGQEVDVSVNLTAPSTPGTYRGYWRVNTNSGVLVPIAGGSQGRSFYVEIKTQNPTTLTPTITTTPPITFAVTNVSFVNTGGCGGFTATANITVNAPGTVIYTWKLSDGTTTDEEDLIFTIAGTQAVSYTWNTTTSGTYWVDIYINTPNDQQFGRAAFTCP